jgi:hypothetical protein
MSRTTLGLQGSIGRDRMEWSFEKIVFAVFDTRGEGNYAISDNDAVLLAENCKMKMRTYIISSKS